MNKSEPKQTQSDVQLKIMQQIEKQEVPDLELEPIIDDQTLDNELNYLMSLYPDNKDSKKETLDKISEEDLF